MQSDQIFDKVQRSRERYVYEANNLVQQWRDLFNNGYQNFAGNIIKPSLKEAADIVGCSKKTLEDYYSILRKAQKIMNIKECLHMKMGYLRQLLKKKKETNFAAPKIEMEEEKQALNNSWNNMIIEAVYEPEQCSSDIDQYFNDEEYYQYSFDQDHTIFNQCETNQKAVQTENESQVNLAQPFEEWSYSKY